MGYKKYIVVALVVTLDMTFIAGCAEKHNDDARYDLSKGELISQIDKLNADSLYNESKIDDLNAEIDELKEKLKGINGDEEEVVGIKEFSDGTGRLTFNSVDGVIKLDEQFKFPHSKTIQSNNAIKITNNVSVVPSSNWVVVYDGTTIEIEHSDGISGKIVVAGLEQGVERVKNDEIKAYIGEYFNNITHDEIQYKTVFYNEREVGYSASLNAYVNEENFRIKCVMVTSGETNITMLFMYKGELNQSKEEIIDRVI
ncbi:MAG: hypothetical protein IJ593_01235, partial [Lachnospiraceae bacterium]|nr:hypothetical protein [Lachnospiraceae bacterium]